MRILLFAVFVSCYALDRPEPFDFIEDAILKYINHSVDPCDNFYRHACSFDSPHNPIEASLENIIEYAKKLQNDSFWNKLEIYWNLAFGFNLHIGDFIFLLKNIRVHLDVDVRQGIYGVRELVNLIVEAAGNLVKETPWAKNEHVVAKIENITSQLQIHDNYGKDFQLAVDTLVNVEKSFVLCKTMFDFVEHADLFCFLIGARTTTFPDLKPFSFSQADNGVNFHPSVAFGFPNYHHFQHGREMSTKLGYTGTTVGHEVGHTFFDNHDRLELLPYFSKSVQDCVQNQFNSTCIEFQEASCATSFEFLDENGADIFGVHMAYKLLQDYYGSKITDKFERLQMTYEQSFFYSYAMSFCSGTPSSVSFVDDGLYEGHSAHNVRVNVVAQHPAFQKAFNCSADSRMMKSATKQCHIYGSKAPETRKRRH
ncbi:Protein CBG22755 [Caenorhabditis briggsae]|uniref:Protein CBG22755 n=1 Tax=Caenorhabditis briggsae TaxID=6238 RepID=A8Y336_CAEBR|nr:Protein CBG22755 [Caenorhabditis briggsae]CAP39273.2 Protein CBG22755 [Caenorhabditis briggsae]